MGVLDMNADFVSFSLAKNLKEKGFNCEYPFAMYNKYEQFCPLYSSDKYYFEIDNFDKHACIAPTISQVLKWLRKGKNIDIEIHAEVGMLGNKVYVPFISTYTEFNFETSPEVVRYRQKKFNPTRSLSHEIVPALVYFKEWEEAAIAGIEYCLDNLI